MVRMLAALGVFLGTTLALADEVVWYTAMNPQCPCASHQLSDPDGILVDLAQA